MRELLRAEALVQVPFYDVDIMRVVWHGHYLKYFERARCALLDDIDYNYSQMEASGYLWPIVDTRIKYIKSARFNQWLRVKAGLVEYENRLHIEYVITDRDSGERLCKGHSIQVAVDAKTREMCYVSPAQLTDKVRASLERNA